MLVTAQLVSRLVCVSQTDRVDIVLEGVGANGGSRNATERV